MKKTDVADFRECLTSKQAAKVLGCSESSLRKKRIEGRGPKFIKAGNKKTSKVLYHLKDLEEYNRQHCQKLSSTAEWRKT